MDKAVPELKLRIKKRPLDGSVRPKMLSSGGFLTTLYTTNIGDLCQENSRKFEKS